MQNGYAAWEEMRRPPEPPLAFKPSTDRRLLYLIKYAYAACPKWVDI